MRVKRGNVAKNRRRKILKALKGGRGSIGTLYRTTQEVYYRAGVFQYRDRRNKRRFLRGLWIQRINAALGDQISYSKFIGLMKKKNIIINRKMLADLAVHDLDAFQQVLAQVNQ